MATYRFVSMKKLKGGDELLTLEKTTKPEFLGKLCGVKPETERVQFVGSCTVWRSYPDFKRQGTMMEAMLCDFWKMAEFKRNNPELSEGESSS